MPTDTTRRVPKGAKTVRLDPYALDDLDHLQGQLHKNQREIVEIALAHLRETVRRGDQIHLVVVRERPANGRA